MIQTPKYTKQKIIQLKSIHKAIFVYWHKHITVYDYVEMMGFYNVTQSKKKAYGLSSTKCFSRESVKKRFINLTFPFNSSDALTSRRLLAQLWQCVGFLRFFPLPPTVQIHVSVWVKSHFQKLSVKSALSITSHVKIYGVKWQRDWDKYRWQTFLVSTVLPDCHRAAKDNEKRATKTRRNWCAEHEEFKKKKLHQQQQQFFLWLTTWGITTWGASHRFNKKKFCSVQKYGIWQVAVDDKLDSDS